MNKLTQSEALKVTNSDLRAWTRIIPVKSLRLTNAFNTAILKSCLQNTTKHAINPLTNPSHYW